MLRKFILAATLAAVTATSLAAPAQAAMWGFGGVHGYDYGAGYWHAAVAVAAPLRELLLELQWALLMARRSRRSQLTTHSV